MSQSGFNGISWGFLNVACPWNLMFRWTAHLDHLDLEIVVRTAFVPNFMFNPQKTAPTIETRQPWQTPPWAMSGLRLVSKPSWKSWRHRFSQRRWWWQLKCFYFSPLSLGKWFNLTSIFFKWVSRNHQLVEYLISSTQTLGKIFTHFDEHSIFFWSGVVKQPATRNSETRGNDPIWLAHIFQMGGSTTTQLVFQKRLLWEWERVLLVR